MGTSDNGQEVLRQNLEEKGTFQALYQMHLLFREKGKRPEGKKILGRLQKEFGQVDLVADVDHSLATFAIADFPVEYKKDKKVIPAQVLMAISLLSIRLLSTGCNVPSCGIVRMEKNCWTVVSIN